MVVGEWWGKNINKLSWWLAVKGKMRCFIQHHIDWRFGLKVTECIFSTSSLSLLEIAWFQLLQTKLTSGSTVFPVILKLLSNSFFFCSLFFFCLFLISPTFQMCHTPSAGCIVWSSIKCTDTLPTILTFWMPHSCWRCFTGSGPIETNCYQAIAVLCLMPLSHSNCCFYCSLLGAQV